MIGIIERIERVEDRDRGVREGRRVDDDAAGGFARLVDPIDDLVLPVALVKPNVEFQFLRQCAAILLDVGQRFVSVNVWLPLAEQVEIGAVQNIDEATHNHAPPTLYVAMCD